MNDDKKVARLSDLLNSVVRMNSGNSAGRHEAYSKALKLFQESFTTQNTESVEKEIKETQNFKTFDKEMENSVNIEEKDKEIQGKKYQNEKTIIKRKMK